MVSENWCFIMGANVLSQEQLIKMRMEQHPENVADAAVDLWGQLANQLVAILGEDGFDSLYVRSVFLARSTFPWLAAGALPPQAEQRFAGLKMSLAGQSPAQASEANILLLSTFTGILAVLIGEELTTSILRSAWGFQTPLAGHSNNVTDNQQGVQK